MRRTHALALLAAAGLALTACVTETVRPTPRPAPKPAAGAPAATLPAGPVGRPSPTDATITATLRLRFVPLGTIPFDGQCLPIVAPEGTFVATQRGDAPTWPTLLAEDTQSTPSTTAIAVYSITNGKLEQIESLADSPAVVLGRAADRNGFLVESIGPGPVRGIGRREWLTGRTEWLVQDDATNAFATFGPSGELAYSRRPAGAVTNELRVRGVDGREASLVLPDTDLVLPTFSSEPNIVFVFAVTPSGTSLLAVRVDWRGNHLGPILDSRAMGAGGSRSLAFQCIAATASPLPKSGAADGPVSPLVLYHPGMRRAAAYDWRNGAFAPFGEASLSASLSPWATSPGYLVTGAKSLDFTRSPAASLAAANEGSRRVIEARIADVPYIVRPTVGAVPAVIAFGPGAPDRLTVLAVSLPPE